MKKLLLFAAAWAVSLLSAQAQCDPTAHDWQGAAFGVSPDPNLGETFVDGYINQPYSDVVYVKAPSSVSEVDSVFENLNIQIDSISLDSITIFNGLADIQLSNIGLNVTCNNNGDSPNPCHFMPGNAYCGDIAGIPTVSGEFQVKIFVTVFFNFLGPQAAPYSFDNYTLTIHDGEIAVIETAAPAITLGQNNPNPASYQTSIQFDLVRSQAVQFEVRNLLGAQVMDRRIQGKKGNNTLSIETSGLEPGVYIYSIQVADKKISKRMVVQR